ncbi:hypothetical protein HON52_01220 [Candidatus Uhrbacteria bacterium]|nr:hypothetical protein [Candidatus Uhrbacteria bacterium]
MDSPWKMYALLMDGHRFPISVSCAARLRKADPKVNITDHSYGQESGWGRDRKPVGQSISCDWDFVNPNRKGPKKPGSAARRGKGDGNNRPKFKKGKKQK